MVDSNSLDKEVTISGKILWTDNQGNEHPVRKSTVKVWDDNFLVDKEITTISTDVNGNYTAKFEYEENLDVYIEVFADGPNHFVENVGVAGILTSTFSEKTTPIKVIPNEENKIDTLKIGNEKKTEQAFSISDALYVGSLYAEEVRGELPTKLEINFSNKADATFFNGSSITIGRDDSWDWDVILHEYGHYLAFLDDFDESLGGDHKPGVSNITPSRGKLKGVRLAWSEGLATYLGIAAQEINKNILPKIEGVGDTSYQDVSNNGGETELYNIEDFLPITLESEEGEGEELSVSRILWDIADGVNLELEAHDEINLGHKELYDILNNNISNLDELNDVWDYFFENSENFERAQYGAIFEEYDVSPEPKGKITKAKNFTVDSEIPEFQWNKNNNEANDRFEVIIFNEDFSQIIETSGQLDDVTAWTPTDEQWQNIISTTPDSPVKRYNYIISGSDIRDPQETEYSAEEQTGSYWSGDYQFNIVDFNNQNINEDIKGSLNFLLKNVDRGLAFLTEGLDNLLLPVQDKVISNFLDNEYPLLGSLDSSGNSVSSLVSIENSSSLASNVDGISSLVSELGFIRNIHSTITNQLNEITEDLLEPIKTSFDLILAEPLNLTEEITNEQLVDLLRELLAQLSSEDTNLVEATRNAVSTTFSINAEDIQAEIEDFAANLYDDLTEKLDDVLSESFKPIQQALYDAVGEEGLNILEDGNNDGEVNVDDVQVTVDSSDGIENADVNFKLSLGKEQTNLSTSLATDIGFDGLGLEVQGDAQVGYDFDLDLDFGFNPTDKFYFNTEGQELTATLGLTVPGLDVQGKLGFLQVNITDEEADPSNLGVDFALDIKDANNDGKLTLAEINDVQLDADLDMGADVNLDLVTSFNGDAKLPSLEADFNLDWNFDNFSKPNNNTGVLLGGNNKPLIGFNNVRLDLGTFFSDFAKPVVEGVQVITKPVEPVLDFLTKEVNIGILKFTPLDIAETLGFIDEQDEQFIESVAQIVNVVNAIPTDSNLEINLGSFDLSNSDVRDTNFEISAAPINITEVVENPEDQISNNSSEGKFLTELSKVPGDGLQFPILSKPTSAFDLLLGKDVDLFTYDLPKLGINFQYESPFIPIIGPLGARFGGEIGAEVDLAFGYDTFGLRQFADSGNASQIFNGFYIDDGGENIPEASLFAELSASAELNAFIAKAGLTGALQGVINLDLNDPNDDGKVRANEFVPLLEDPECIFDITGEIAAALRAYVKLGFKPVQVKKRFNLARITLVEFGHQCDDNPPILATHNNSTLLVNIGPNASGRVYGTIKDGDDFVVIEHKSGTPGNETIAITGQGITQEYSNFNEIVIEGGNAHDYIDIKPGVLTPARLKGGEGDDWLIGGDGNDLIEGNDGFDYLEGGGGQDTLKGGEGDDWLIGGAGADVLEGGEGDDTASYENSTEGVLFDLANPQAGSGDAQGDTFESIEEYEGSLFNDTLIGDETGNSFSGLSGDDLLQGKGGQDTFEDGEGNDTVEGGDGDDFFISGAGADSLDGGNGEDTASYISATNGLVIDLENTADSTGEAQGDTYNSIEIIEATYHDDTLRGSTSDDPTLRGLDGNDLLIGKAGNDSLEGGEGDDKLEGNEGFDTLDGGGDNDLLIGRAGNDSLEGGEGDDELEGNQGADTLDGGEGHDLASYKNAPTAVRVNLANTQQNTREAQGDLYISIEEFIASVFNDTLIGGLGNDIFNGNAGNDILNGGVGADTLNGDEDNDILNGHADNDLLNGGSGEDTLNGGAGADTLNGDEDNDILKGGVGNDFLNGGLGEDTLNGGTGADILNGDEDNDILKGNAGDDILVGGDHDDSLIGGVGDDVLYGDGGDDTLIGGAGEDILNGGAGNDSLIGGIENDIFYGDGGNDTLIGGAGNDTLNGGAGDDTLIGGAGNDTLNGSFGNDTLNGGVGDDILTGGAEDDSLIGGAGDDTLNGDAGNDSLTGGIGNDTLNGSFGNDTLNGGAGDDTLGGSFGNDSLNGGAGKDSLNGGFGKDTLNGDAGSDSLTGGEGSDILTGGAGKDTLNGDAGSDSLTGGEGNDILTGGAEDDTLNGGVGNDTLTGDGGNDSLNGGIGNDTLTGGLGDDNLTGGAGIDLFILDCNTNGVDTITDFETGIDLILIQGNTGNISYDSDSRQLTCDGNVIAQLTTGTINQSDITLT